MREEEKLAEAKYFLGRMKLAEAEANEVVYRYELSAFLSAARSVLQYACKESKDRGFQGWYQKAVESDACIRYLKEERDLNIHSKPAMFATLLTQESGPIIEGEEHSTVERTYCLGEWRGPEGATALGERYLTAVEAVEAIWDFVTP